MTGLLFDLNCEFSTGASLLALAKSIYYRNDLKGNKNCFDMAGGSSHGEFELPRVNNSKFLTEIQGISIDGGSS